MTKLGYIYLLLIMLLTTTVNSAMSSAMAAEVCTDLVKPVRYKVKKGDHIAEILRTFKLEPVFGTKGSLAKLLQINHIPNQNLIQPGDEILIPFRCEEQITGWSTQSKDQHRTVELKKIKVDFTKETATSAEPTEPVKT